MAALLGYYVTDVAIHFVFTVLYVLSPLMILAYVPESTAHITRNLYMGLLTVSSWKILWCLLGTLLLKLTTVPETQDWDSFIMQSLTNVCIGLSMLGIPFFTRSLLGDGLIGIASSGGSKYTSPVSRRIENLPAKTTMGITKTAKQRIGGPVRRQFIATKKRLQKVNNDRKLATFYRKNGIQKQTQQNKGEKNHERPQT